MRKIILIVCLLLLRTTVFAGDGYQFLRVGVTARATGLGDVFVAQPGDATTFMYNPAGLATLQGRTFAASYKESLPLSLQAGVNYKLQNAPVTVNLTFTDIQTTVSV